MSTIRKFIVKLCKIFFSPFNTSGTRKGEKEEKVDVKKN